MLDSLFISINSWILDSFIYALIGSFIWGMISVLLSPCHLASIPLMIGYVAGQKKVLTHKEAAIFSLLFSIGLFISIAFIGIFSLLLDRMMGDVSIWWNFVVGLLFVYVGFGMLRTNSCQNSTSSLSKITLKGYFGAFVLGLSYGILSGACTFGFIAPILGIASKGGIDLLVGILLMIAFAVGHCLPIVLAGSCVSMIQRFLLQRDLQNIISWSKKIAGGLVIFIGFIFILNTFLS